MKSAKAPVLRQAGIVLFRRRSCLPAIDNSGDVGKGSMLQWGPFTCGVETGNAPSIQGNVGAFWRSDIALSII